MLTIGDLGGRGDDRVGLVGVQQAEVLVHLGASTFEQTERADLGALQRAERDREVLHRALGLSSPERVLRYPDFAHGVVLDPILAGLLPNSGVGAHVCPSCVGDYGNGYAAVLSPVKSTAEYSLSLDRRW